MYCLFIFYGAPKGTWGEKKKKLLVRTRYVCVVISNFLVLNGNFLVTMKKELLVLTRNTLVTMLKYLVRTRYRMPRSVHYICCFRVRK